MKTDINLLFLCSELVLRYKNIKNLISKIFDIS
jgi:hypothetical protein